MTRSIRVNYLYEQCEGDWSRRYNEAVIEALSEFYVAEALNVTHFDTDAIERAVKNAPWCDVWFVFSIFDKWVKPVWERIAKYDERMVVHNHGGMETGDYEALLYGLKDTTVFPKIVSDPKVKVLFNSQSNLSEFKFMYGDVNGEITGFPVQPSIERTEFKIRPSIVVPGRLSIGKQPLLAAKILAPYRDITTFCTGEEVGKNDDTFSVLSNLGFTVVRVRGDAYFKLLDSRRVGFTASLADSLNSSCVEMAAMGLRVVAPNLPLFDYLPFDWRYEPYSIRNARENLHRALTEEWEPVDVSQFSRREFKSKVRTLLKDWIDVV